MRRRRRSSTSFSIAPTSASPDYAAGSQVVTITGLPASCVGGDWTTSGNGSSITVSPASGSGPGSATVSWTQNTGAQRSGDATVAGNTFPVTQGAAPPPVCTSFSIAPTSASPDYPAGSQLVTITGLPASCVGGDWTTSGNGSWITVSPASGSGPGSATVSWTENTGAQRSGNATVAGNCLHRHRRRESSRSPTSTGTRARTSSGASAGRVAFLCGLMDGPAVKNASVLLPAARFPTGSWHGAGDLPTAVDSADLVRRCSD